MSDSNDAGEELANAPGDLSGLESALKTATRTSAPDAAGDNTDTSKKQEKPDWIEDKFWNGDLNESAQKQAQAYKPLQSAYGRMANDLGTQRKLTDRILALDKRDVDLGAAAPPKPKVDASKLVNNPTEALDEYVSARLASEREEASKAARKSYLEAQEAAFTPAHPDYADVTSSPEFAAWVRGSELRSRAAALAASGDFGVATALLSEYKAGKAATTSQSNTRRTDPNLEAARAASTENAANASTGPAKGKIYRRSDLIALKVSKPEVYSDPKFQEEIFRAYNEGRVR